MRREAILLRMLLILVPFAALVGLLIPTLIGKRDLTILSSYLAIPMLLSVLLFYIFRNRASSDIKLSDKYFKVPLIAFNFLLILAIYLLYSFEERTMYFFVTVALMYLVLLIEILFFEKDHTKAILFQNMVVVLLYIWSVNLNYYLFIGRTDLLGHRLLIDSLLEHFHITEDFGIYSQFPLWHIEVGQAKILAGLSLGAQDVMFIINGIVYCVFLLFTYKASSILINNNKVALISALVVSFYPDFLYGGMSSISKSLAMFFVPMIFYLILNKGIKFVLLSLFMTIIVIMYHTVSIPFILLLFLIIYIISKLLYQEKNRVVITFNYIVVSTVITIVYWSFSATVLYSAVIHNIFNPAYEEIISNFEFVLPFNELMNYIQYGIILLFMLIGIYFVLNSESNSYKLKAIMISSIIFVFISIPGPILLIDKLATNFNFIRFQNYTILFLALPCAFGIYLSFIKFNKIGKTILLSVILIFCFLSISNDFVASDNPFIERTFYTYYLTENEESSFNSIAAISNNYILSDYVSTRYYYYSQYNEKYHIMEVSSEKGIIKYNANDIILLRTLELSKRPLKIYRAQSVFYLRPAWDNNIAYYFKDSLIWSSLNTYNIIYSSNDVVAYI